MFVDTYAYVCMCIYVCVWNIQTELIFCYAQPYSDKLSVMSNRLLYAKQGSRKYQGYFPLLLHQLIIHNAIHMKQQYCRTDIVDTKQKIVNINKHYHSYYGKFSFNTHF